MLGDLWKIQHQQAFPELNLWLACLNTVHVTPYHISYVTWHFDYNSTSFSSQTHLLYFQISLRSLPQWQQITHPPLGLRRQPIVPSAGYPDRCSVAMQLRRRETVMQTARERRKTEGRQTRLNW